MEAKAEFFTVRIEPCPEGGFIASFPALPGCYTQAETIEVVVYMAREALNLHLQSLVARDLPVPREVRLEQPTHFDLPLRVWS